MKKSGYTFSSLKPPGSSTSNAKAKAIIEEDDEDEGEQDDTFVNRFFTTSKKTSATTSATQTQQQPPLPNKKSRTEDAPEHRDYDNESRSTSMFLKHVRPKPDLGGDESSYHSNPSAAIGRILSLAAKAPAKEIPIRFREREKKLSHLSGDDRRRYLREENQRKLSNHQQGGEEKYWMSELLKGSKRSLDDRSPFGGRLVLRSSYLQDAAYEHSTGKKLFHNQFVAIDGNMYSGRFFVEPHGSKPNELNTAGMTLYLFIHKTGPDGLTLRVDRKFYELFEGDVAIIPSGALYSFVNPSQSGTCIITYTLVRDVTSDSKDDEAQENEEDEEDEDDDEEDEQREGSVTSDNVLEASLPWKKTAKA